MTYGLRFFITKHEFYSIQTPYTSPKLWDCLVPVLVREKLDHLLKLSQTNEHKEGVKADVLRAVEEYGMYGAPWFVATRSDGKQDVFFGADKLDNMAWWLGGFLASYRIPAIIVTRGDPTPVQRPCDSCKAGL